VKDARSGSGTALRQDSLHQRRKERIIMSNAVQAPMVRERQAPLRSIYREEAARAWVVDHASIESRDLEDPFHGTVRFGSVSTAEAAYAVHGALGGVHDGPVPGDLLCAALASCQESSVRMVSNVFGVRLTELKVDVQAGVDVRGTLGMDPKVPVGFQWFRVDVRLRAGSGTPADRLRQVIKAAERSCVVLQTLRLAVPVTVTFDASPEDQR
jgi:uncharacterized OsmC-like protein